MKNSRATETQIHDLVDSFWIFLSRNGYTAHLESFKRRLKDDEKAADAEAVVFSFLWSAKRHPDMSEVPGKGGPDFCCCISSEEKFLVEVTSLDSVSVSDRSGLPEKISGPGGSAYALITSKLQGVAKRKAPQLSEHPYPRVLAITLKYDFAGLLMDRRAASELLVGKTWFHVPIGQLDAPTYTTVDPSSAVFYDTYMCDPSGRSVMPRLQSISAILLVSIFPNQSEVVGILHPEPSVLFDLRLFPQVPFLRFKHWPPIDGRPQTEWILGEDGQDYAAFRHKRII
jgi:hypothetical protein